MPRPSAHPDPTDPAMVEFVPFEPSPGVPNHLGDRLCTETVTFDDPSTEKVELNCRFEGGWFARPDVAPTDELVVMTWNIGSTRMRGAPVGSRCRLSLDGGTPERTGACSDDCSSMTPPIFRER